MIVWINGAFGAGKTSTARELAGLLPDSTLFDPEFIGDALRVLLPRKRLAEVGDYQDLPSWRRLVVDTAAAMLGELGGVLVVPMTLLRQEYRDEIFGGLAARRIPVRHVLLAPAETILRERMAGRRARQEPQTEPQTEPADPQDRHGAYEHISTYQQALGWLTADAHVIDNGAIGPRETAERIAEAVRTDAARVCDIVQTPEPTRETVAAGVLLFDERDRVLLVDPTYKAGWEFPGGVVESGEAPARAGIREVEEELGLALDRVPGLLVVDWEPPRHPAYGGLRLLFDGGRLTEPDIANLRLPGPELRQWRFVTEPEAATLLPPQRRERLRWALRARERGHPLYLEAGRPTP
ncbi:MULTISPECIES: NUDIX domain-containing protein [unclassified Streptomyces]|uniref:NUDIX hydrolase n=1 Tax=unclassified Streptomyces TaxID=2593676 RepID=UPI0022586A78|nr:MULTISPECIES: NUDIX domain-containing protein [unclassified Streptomyces]MCX4524511.1 NUDIX domain-containing protein [Streptomyces sp. NBC_01551]MCX4544964.1 NUDIX domain-containing protein [Streptomyces sp. NBC_01565]